MENPNLRYYLDRSVRGLVRAPAYSIAHGEQERHRIYCLLLMALVKYYWNGSKKGRHGTYLWAPKETPRPYGADDYLGHNVAAIAVNDRGQILDLEFNHNILFNSSAEHAEARLIRRIYGLSQVMDAYSDSGARIKPKNDYDTFEDVTVYTSLESCSQCAGVMSLARVKQVVYLQADPGMYRVGNILYNLTRAIKGVSEGRMTAPIPIPANVIGFPHMRRLDAGFVSFCARVPQKAFFMPTDGTPDASPSITSFLCTDNAYKIFAQASGEFFALTSKALKHARFRPPQAKLVPKAEVLTNAQALVHAKRFFEYASIAAKRGTPHP